MSEEVLDRSQASDDRAALMQSLAVMDRLAERMHASRFASWVLPLLNEHERDKPRLLRHLTVNQLKLLEHSWSLDELARAPRWWHAPQSAEQNCIAMRIAYAVARPCIRRTLTRAEIHRLNAWLESEGIRLTQAMGAEYDCLATLLADENEPRRWIRHDAFMFGVSCMHAALEKHSRIAARLFALQFNEYELQLLTLTGNQLLAIEAIATHSVAH
ncbi:MAG: hypothetical protein ACRDAM_05640 [Casimicrobium sp.]